MVIHNKSFKYVKMLTFFLSFSQSNNTFMLIERSFSLCHSRTIFIFLVFTTLRTYVQQMCALNTEFMFVCACVCVCVFVCICLCYIKDEQKSLRPDADLDADAIWPLTLIGMSECVCVCVCVCVCMCACMCVCVCFCVKERCS